MIMNRRAQILRLNEPQNGVYQWEAAKAVRVQAALETKTNLFSRMGIGARTMTLTVRRTEVTLHDAFVLAGEHLFITDILPQGVLFLQITCARVVCEPCTAMREKNQTGEMNLARRVREQVAKFPAVMTEKYVKFAQASPMSETETALVMVTPKVIVLAVGDLVRRGTRERLYAVRAVHELDEYKNEYEIVLQMEA